MIRNHNHALREFELNTSTHGGQDLALDRLVTANSNSRRAKKMRHRRNGERKRSLRHGHVRIEPIALNEIQRRADQLSDTDSIEKCYCERAQVKSTGSDVRWKVMRGPVAVLRYIHEATAINIDR